EGYGTGTGGTSSRGGLASALVARTHCVNPNGQRERERGALAYLAVHPDPAPVQFDELLGERQPEPRALLLAGVVPADLAELLEDGRLILRRDPDPRVMHGDRDHLRCHRDGEVDPTAVRGEFDRVGEQVQQ